jgi:hypothetical protein
MYFGSVLLLMLILPMTSIFAEAIRFGHSITGIAALQKSSHRRWTFGATRSNVAHAFELFCTDFVPGP